jgi:predicted phage-related endonuclease
MMGMDDSMRNYMELGEAIKRLKAQQDEVKAQLCQQLGDKSVGLGLDYSFSWKSQSTRRLNSKRLQEDHPDLFEEYAETSVTRVFRVKRNK